MNVNFKLFNLMGLALFAMILFSSCEKENYGSPKETEEEVKEKLYIDRVDHPTYGYILTNREKQSMYFFAEDVKEPSQCVRGCEDVWPPVIIDFLYNLEYNSSLEGSYFDTYTRDDGRKQLTYKGWPLYYHSPNGDGQLEARKEVLGDGKGGVFHVAKPDYTVLLGKRAVETGKEPVTYLVDDYGVALYLNTPDGVDVSNCAGRCAEVWPPFKKEKIVVPSTLKDYDFKNISREDGLGPQVSYKGYPLYYFIQDEGKRALLLGQGGGPNNTFFVVGPQVQ